MLRDLCTSVPVDDWKTAKLFFFNDTATTEIYTLSLHDALPIYTRNHGQRMADALAELLDQGVGHRSEEHTSELQSPCNLVCRLLLEKKKNRSRQTWATSYLHRTPISNSIASPQSMTFFLSSSSA